MQAKKTPARLVTAPEEGKSMLQEYSVPTAIAQALISCAEGDGARRPIREVAP